MIEIEMSRDVREYSPKFLGPFDKRQWVIILLALAVAVPLLFLLGSIPMQVKLIIILIPVLPIILTGWVKVFGMPLEVFVWRFVLPNILYPRKKVYITENAYESVLVGKGRNMYKADPLLRTIPPKKMKRKERKILAAKLKKYRACR